LALTAVVQLPGYVPDAAAHFPSFTVFALPSRSEGLPIVLLEAMNAALPIVACRVGGVPEVLDDGRAGLLVDAENAGAMAVAIEHLLSDDALAATVAAAARQRVATCYSDSTMVARYVALYEGLPRAAHEAVA
jgi:glycosyltransferase involved in cell wall biosynthesis